MNTTDYKSLARGLDWYNWHKWKKVQIKFDFETKHSARTWRFHHRWRVSGNHPWEIRRR